MKCKWLKGTHVYPIVLDKITIYMKLNIWKHVQNREYKFEMHESSKLSYTSTSNGYKWAIEHKHIKIKCSSLVVQVYTQVLIKNTSKHVIKKWSTKYQK